MDWLELQKATQEKLDQVSPSFCLAKWLQVTLHLQTGFTHSCHHPVPHKIPLEEIKNDCGALHNTCFKKAQRKQMLEGSFPEECRYCWDVENSSNDRFSDRVIKSSDEWASQYLDRVLSCGARGNIAPTYLEVSFGFNCNLGCIYCSPDVSSTIWKDFEKHGSYPTIFPESELEVLKSMGKKPYRIDEVNPYVEAFWEWFPAIKDGLRVFRITGGEPLLNVNTFKVLDFINANPMPQTSLSINSNLIVSTEILNDLIVKVNDLVDSGKVKDFTLYTSADSSGKAAEFIRWGFNYSLFKKNIEQYLEKAKSPVTIMVTYSILSATSSFIEFLRDYLSLREKYIHDNGSNFKKLVLDVSYLHQPQYLSVKNLDIKTMRNIQHQLDYMKKFHSDIVGPHGFSEYEINKFERIYNVANEGVLDRGLLLANRYSFKLLVDEYGRRKRVSFLEIFPELAGYYNLGMWKYLLVRLQTNQFVNSYHPVFVQKTLGWKIPLNPRTLLNVLEDKKKAPFFEDAVDVRSLVGEGPLTLNLSFGNKCKMACCYCSADESCKVFELNRQDGLSEHVREELVEEIFSQRGILIEENNEVTDVFWESFLKNHQRIREIHLTGGEPLQNENTFRLLHLMREGVVELESFVLESSLMTDSEDLLEVWRTVDSLLSLKKMKKFKLITRIDSYGKQAEYIRAGLNFEKWKCELENYLERLESAVCLKITYTVFSCGNEFKRLIDYYSSLRSRFGKRVTIDLSGVYYPRYLSLSYIDYELDNIINEQLSYFIEREEDVGQDFVAQFKAMIFEKNKFESSQKEEVFFHRHDFTQFVEIYDRRAGLNFQEIFPELVPYYLRISWKCLIIRLQTNQFVKTPHPQLVQKMLGWKMLFDPVSLLKLQTQNRYPDLFTTTSLEENCFQGDGPVALNLSFSNRCNLSCCYCGADESSHIYEQNEARGVERILKEELAEKLLRRHDIIIEDNEKVTSEFWRRFLQHSKQIKKIQLTGGEPLLDSNTFKLLDLMERDVVNLDLLVLESSLMVEEEVLLDTWKRVRLLLESKKLGDFKLITRIDSYGEQAEYIRAGLDFNKWKQEVERYLQLLKTKICFKVMYTVFSAGDGFFALIDYYASLKTEEKRELLEIELCRSYRPRYLDFLYVDNDFVQRLESQLSYIVSLGSQIGSDLALQFKSMIAERASARSLSKEEIVLIRHEFLKFIEIHDGRAKMNFEELFPELMFHLNRCDHKHIVFRAQTGYVHWSYHPDVLLNQTGWELRTNASTLEEFRFQGEYDQYFHQIEDWTDFLAHSGDLSLDVSLNNICSFNCLYCTSDESSSIERQRNLSGGIKLLDWRDELYVLKKVGKKIIQNPNTSLFDQIICCGRLREIYFDGGEPLQYSKLREVIKKTIDLNKNLALVCIRTSLGAKEDVIILKELDRWKSLVRIDSGMDLAGEAGEYVRAGISYDVWLENIRIIMTTLQCKLRVNINYTLFSTGDAFLTLVNEIVQMRQKYSVEHRVEIVFNHIYKPGYFCIRNCDQQFIDRMKGQLDYLVSNAGVFPQEVGRFKRLIEIIEKNPYGDLEKQVNCINFFQFISLGEGTFLATFPELHDYYERGKVLHQKIMATS